MKKFLQYICTWWVMERYKPMELERTKSVENTYDMWDMTCWRGSVVAIFVRFIRVNWLSLEFSSVNIDVSIWCIMRYRLYGIESKGWDWVKIQYRRSLKYDLKSIRTIITYWHEVTDETLFVKRHVRDFDSQVWTKSDNKEYLPYW